MSFLSLIESKREGRILDTSDIESLVTGFVDGLMPDYQMAALLMAVYFQGLNPRETRDLTLAMRNSGEILHFPDDPRPLVDKHSTGGVGDKVSLPLAPLLASLGLRVPMISGRGLGITGGTLDKMESVPGLTTALAPAQIIDQVQEIGLAMAGQTQTMVPADKALYALRDVTATVPSIPLITASILSKKLAENLDALVMDVKWGRAAFMKTPEQAASLANALVDLAQDCGLKIHATQNPMNHPLGQAVGNWLEVKESVACLQGKGPADLRQLVLQLAAHLLVLVGRHSELELALDEAGSCLDSGEALARWESMLQAQGADMEGYHTRLQQDHLSPIVHKMKAPHSGRLTDVNAEIIGSVVRDLGGGRLDKTSVIKPEVGLDRVLQVGQSVRAEDCLCRIHAVSEEEALISLERLNPAFVIETK